MFNVGDTLLKLATESGFAGFFANGGWQNLVMIVIACVLRGAAACPMPAQAAPHMAMQCGPPARPITRAVTAREVCMAWIQ